MLKREHCLSKVRKRGISAVTEECLLSAMALNLKRMAKAILLTLHKLKIWTENISFQSGFLFCQQAPYWTLSFLKSILINLELPYLFDHFAAPSCSIPPLRSLYHKNRASGDFVNKFLILLYPVKLKGMLSAKYRQHARQPTSQQSQALKKCLR